MIRKIGTVNVLTFELHNFGFQTGPGLIQTELYKHGRWLEAGNFGFKKRVYIVCVAKTKALIRCAQLICTFVFIGKNHVSYDSAHLMISHFHFSYILRKKEYERERRLHERELRKKKKEEVEGQII